jgi:hypothetical protein
VNAFLLFDHDLLVNALLLDAIDSVNADADAVLERWYDQEPISVMGKESKVLFDYTDYLNAVRDAELEQGEYLSFADYAQLGQGITLNRPSQVKRVLEDGLLGSSFSFSDAVGKTAPALNGTKAALGQDMVLTCESDDEYISKITGLTLDGSELIDGAYLKHYEKAEDGKSITIYSESKGSSGGYLQLTAGTHVLHIVADDYENVDVTLQVEKELEQFDLSLVKNSEEESGNYRVGQDVHVNAAAEESEDKNELRGDFMKNLTGITLRKPDGSTVNVTSDTEGQIGGDDNYVKGEFSFTLLKGLFKEAGDYTVTVSADGYQAKILDFKILEADVIIDDEDELDPPEMESAEYIKDYWGYDNYYRIALTGVSDKEIEAYLNSAVKTVTVNDKEYQETSYFWNSKKSYKVAKDESYGVCKFLDLTEDGFEKGENTVIVKAEGYEDLELTLEILEDGTVAESKKDEVPDKGEIPDDEISGDDEILGDDDEYDAPTVDNVMYESNFSYSAYRVSFSSLTADGCSEYLNQEEMNVTVNGNEYSKVAYSFYMNGMSYKVSQDGYGEDKYLDFTTDGFAAGENTIVIEVSGYKTIAITFIISDNMKEVSSISVIYDLDAEEENNEIAGASVSVEEEEESEEAVETEKTEDVKDAEDDSELSDENADSEEVDDTEDSSDNSIEGENDADDSNSMEDDSDESDEADMDDSTENDTDDSNGNDMDESADESDEDGADDSTKDNADDSVEHNTDDSTEDRADDTADDSNMESDKAQEE